MSVVFIQQLILLVFWPPLPPVSSFFVPSSLVGYKYKYKYQSRSVVSSFQQQPQPQDVLLPQENPARNETQTSLSGVLYEQVLDGLARLYPPEALSERNAASRTDGYWPYLQKGQDPPPQFTYGEFDLVFFAQLLDRVHAYYSTNNTTTNNNNHAWKDKVFCDIGSGTGRLVLGAAALHPGWKLCRGIEILPKIAQLAQTKLEQCAGGHATCITTASATITSDDKSNHPKEQEQDEWVENEHGLFVKEVVPGIDHANDNNDNNNNDDVMMAYSLPIANDKRLPLAPVEFVRGSFDDPYLYLGDVDCVFCFSSCMSKDILQSLSQAMGRQCRPGTLVITTDFPLELEGTLPPHGDDDDEESLPHGNYQLDLIEQLDGYCWLTGGISTAYIHRVTRSLWTKDGGPRTRPLVSTSDKAFRAICAMEAERGDAAVRFLTGVRNNMVFAGFPEPWWPDPSRYKNIVEESNQPQEQQEGNPIKTS